MLEKHSFVGKDKEDILKQIKTILNKEENEVILASEEQKKGLFSKKEEYKVILIEDLNNFIKDTIIEVVKNMGLDPKIETKKRKDNIIFTLIAENNGILIGKNGRTIDAIQTIIRTAVYNEITDNYNFIIDVSDYKQKNEARLERLAKYTAKDVARTKISVKLDPMNSYERRIIHNILNDSKDVDTVSQGEEPNRYVVIKPKEN